MDVPIDRQAVEDALGKYFHQETISLWEMANLFDAAKEWLHATSEDGPTAGLGWQLKREIA